MKDRVYITIIFFILGVLSFFGFTSFTYKSIFGLAFGGFLINVYPNCDIDIETKIPFIKIKVKFWIILKGILKFFSYFFIFAFVFIDKIELLNKLMNKVDDTTLILFSIAFSLLGINTSSVENKRKELKIREETTNEVIEKILKKIKDRRI